MSLSAQKREAEVRGHKDRAAQLLGKNKLEPALGSLTAALALSPHDTSLRQKQAEVLVRLNRKDEAVRAYQHVVGAWADEGHLLRAIAICKVILQLDARHTETQNALADLYARHRGDHVASVPAAMGAELGVKRPDSTGLATPVEPPEAEEILQATAVEVEPELVIEVDDGDIEVDPPRTPQLPLFSELGPAAFTAVLEGTELEAFAPGEVIVSEGARDERMFALVQGTADVVRGKKAVAELKEGDFFGEMALVTGAPRLAGVVANTEVVALVFEKSRVAEIAAEHPSVDKALDRFYRERLLANLLRSSPMFQELSDAAREAVSHGFKVKSFGEGEAIVEQGKSSDALYLLLRGHCAVIESVGCKERALPGLSEGDVFGEISLIRGTPATATVRAITDCTVLRLGQALFKEHVLKSAKVAESLRRLGAERLARSAALARVGATLL